MGGADPKLASVLINRAEANRLLRRYDEAESLIVRARSILELGTGLTQIDGARTLHQMACIYLDQARFGRAEPTVKEALSIANAVLTPNHPYHIAILLTAAELDSRLGRSAAAEEHYRRALSQDVADDDLQSKVLRDYAALLRQLRRKDEAKKVEQRAERLVSTKRERHLVDVREIDKR